MFCTTCGTQLAEGARFCTTCGSAVGSPADAAEASDQPPAGPPPSAETAPAPTASANEVPYPSPAPAGVPQAFAQTVGVVTKDRPPVLQPLPTDIVLSSAGRRLGAYLLDWLLVIFTLVIGWFVWSMIVWTKGQSPGKQLLKMRVIRSDNLATAGWGRMFLRDFICKGIIGFVAGILIGIGLILYFWLLWDGERQELWDKMASTLVVDDPNGKLDPSRRVAAGPAYV